MFVLVIGVMLFGINVVLFIMLMFFINLGSFGLRWSVRVKLFSGLIVIMVILLGYLCVILMINCVELCGLSLVLGVLGLIWLKLCLLCMKCVYVDFGLIYGMLIFLVIGIFLFVIL